MQSGNLSGCINRSSRMSFKVALSSPRSHLLPPLNVHIERSSVGDVAQAGFLGHQHGGLPIGFDVHRLGEVDLRKLHLHSHKRGWRRDQGQSAALSTGNRPAAQCCTF